MPSLKLTWNSKALSVSLALNGTLLMLRWVQACCSPRLITGHLLAGWMAGQEPILGRLAARWGRMTCLFVFNYQRGSLKMFPWLSISYRVAERQRVRTGRVTTEAPTTPPKKLEPQCCSWSQEATTSAPSQGKGWDNGFLLPSFLQLWDSIDGNWKKIQSNQISLGLWKRCRSPALSRDSAAICAELFKPLAVQSFASAALVEYSHVRSMSPIFPQ